MSVNTRIIIVLVNVLLLVNIIVIVLVISLVQVAHLGVGVRFSLVMRGV